MISVGYRWGKLVYPLAVHHSSKIRERAMHAMEVGMPAMMEYRESLVVQLVPDLKSVSLHLVFRVECYWLSALLP